MSEFRERSCEPSQAEPDFEQDWAARLLEDCEPIELLRPQVEFKHIAITPPFHLRRS